MKRSVKLFTFLSFFFFNCFVLQAQQKHFIYVQSEDKQPFAIVLGGKVYSASEYGYVIVPKLVDSTYKFTVSFPMNKYPDQAFTCIINKKDAGYMLKNEANGWVLQNMQTQKVTMNSTAAAAQKNAFSDMLSDVVSDSDLTKNNIVQKPVAAANNNSIITDSILHPEKISESKLDTGINMLFVDKTQTGVDTINVFVPAETTNNNLTADQKTLPDNSAGTATVIPAAINNDASQNNVPSGSASAITNTQDTTAQQVSNPFYKPAESTNNTAANPTSNIVNQAAAFTVSNAVKQDCSNMISDNDLDKLKRKMFVQNNDNDMIQYAVKYLNKKCITTDQVKLLGSLFSSDDGRYNLYDALYNYVYDYGNYPGLSNQILDPYYKKRFAAMLR